MQISLVSLLTPIFCLLMVLRVLSLYYKSKQTWRELVVWLVVWFGIALVSLYPPLLDGLPAVIGIKSGVNVLIFFGFILLFYGFFRLFVKVEELENKIVEMNRDRALKSDEEEKNS